MVDSSSYNSTGMLQHLLLSTFYGLNRSYTKKIFIGFDLNDTETEFEFVFRLCGNNFNSGYLALNHNGWKRLQTYFSKIDEYLQGKNMKNSDQTFENEDFTIKLTRSYYDKAIEISSEEKKPDNKKFKVSLVLKKVSFDTLKNLSQVIDTKFDQLNAKRTYLFLLKDKFINYITEKLNASEKNIITQINIKDIKLICNEFDEKVTENFKQELEQESPELESASLNDSHLFLKELYALNFDYLISTICNKLDL